MVQSRAFLFFAALGCLIVCALGACTGKVTGGETNAAAQAAAGAREDRGGISRVDAGMAKAGSAEVESRPAEKPSGGAGAPAPPDAGVVSEPKPPERDDTPARDSVPPEPASTAARDGAAEEDAGLACEPLAAPRAVTYPRCAPELCAAGDSVCVPGGAVQGLGIPFATATALTSCEGGGKCVATAIVEQAGHVRLPQCTSIAGAEGRCVSTCMPLGTWQPDALPRDTCAASERCMPCYDPLDGRATGACALGCDRGPSESPKKLAACCGGRGQCLPPGSADSGSLKIPRDTCEADAVCMPSSLVDARTIPRICESVDGAEGRCLSTCLGKISKLPDLPSDGCNRDEVCAPCYDPITGGATGACTLHGDAPTRPAHRFERCCGSGREVPAGVCVPPSLTRSRTADFFRRDSCARGRVCVPTVELVDPDYHYPLCLSVGLGVCMPSCLFDPLDALLFTSLTCDRGDVCAPCSPLIDGCN